MNDSRSNTQRTTRSNDNPPIIITQTTLGLYDFQVIRDKDKDKR